MPKKTVKRCSRPQCMEIYEETEKNRFCMCGALLQTVEIEFKPKKNTYKKPTGPVKPKVKPVPKPAKTVSPLNEQDSSEDNENEGDNDISETKAFLYLLLDDEEVEYELSNITRIGRAADGVQVDIDLSEYAGKDVSREHAVIRKEKDGYYITNVSRNHSVRIMDKDDNEVALEYGKKVLLKSEDGILLSKKVLLQFVEEE